MNTEGTSLPHVGRIKLFLWLYYGPLGVAVLVGVVAQASLGPERAESLAGPLGLFLVPGLVLSWVLFYQAWRFSITTSKISGLTPSIESAGRAVGLCFVPLYNLYWVFKAFPRLPSDLNYVAIERDLEFRAPETLGYYIPILTLLSLIPVVGIITGLVNFLILYPLYLVRVVGMCHALGKALQERG